MIVGRLGGEEFGVFLPECDLASAQEFSQAICDAFRGESFDVGGPKFSQTASFGVAEYFTDEPMSSLYARADLALYQAKAAGRNRVCLAVSPQTDNDNKYMGFVQNTNVAA